MINIFLTVVACFYPFRDGRSQQLDICGLSTGDSWSGAREIFAWQSGDNNHYLHFSRKSQYRHGPKPLTPDLISEGCPTLHILREVAYREDGCS